MSEPQREHLSEDELLDLILDHPSDSQSSAVDHLDACPRCRDAYDELSRVVDGTLAASPAVAPPAGFETRVLARLEGPAPVAGPGRRRISLLVAASVAAGLLLGGLATVAVQSTDDTAGTPVAAAGEPLVTGDGEDVGAVLRSRYADRDVLVIVVHDGSPGTEYLCRVRLPDGTMRDAGRWVLPGSGRAVWVTQMSATQGRVELVAADAGEVWATAELAG